MGTARAALYVIGIAVAVFLWSTVAHHDAIEEADVNHFIANVRDPLQTRVGTVDLAVERGYTQMTTTGPDGTAIYFDRTFDGIDPLHPNFLWFDKHNKLVGVDYEVSTAAFPVPPGHALFPVKQSRWTIVPAHVHIAYKETGVLMLREGDAQPNLIGGNVSAETLTADGLLPYGDRLMWFSFHPRSWDLSLWLKHNPLGATAAYNPWVYL
jgi:hypothetical protein